MIKIQTQIVEHVLTPTFFPDGTSQVWKLPDNVLSSTSLNVVWNFEAEREIIDLLSLRRLFPYPECQMSLHVPFMPYSRQDKWVGNNTTFNLAVIADLINSMNFMEVTSVDVHNPLETAKLIKNFKNIEATPIHRELIAKMEPNFLVFPDLGAQQRYYKSEFANVPRVICYKTRDQSNGQITDHTMSYRDTRGETIHGVNMKQFAKAGDKFLIIDDICDGGATFIGIANKLRSQVDGIKIYLFVTHGIFSKGRDVLMANGIKQVYTTNSLLKNEDGYEV